MRQDCNWSIFFLSHLFPTQHHQDHSYIWRCSDALRERKDVRERWKNYHVKLCFLSNSNAYLTALWQIRTLEFLALPNVIKTIPMHFWKTFFENLQVRVIIRLIEEGYLLSKVTYFQKSPISKGNVLSFIFKYHFTMMVESFLAVTVVVTMAGRQSRQKDWNIIGKKILSGLTYPIIHDGFDRV